MSKLKYIFEIFLIRQPSARCRRSTSTLCLFDSLLWRDTLILCFDERIGHCWNLRWNQYRMDKRVIYNCLYLVWMFMDSWRVQSIASVSLLVFWQHLHLATFAHGIAKCLWLPECSRWSNWKLYFDFSNNKYYLFGCDPCNFDTVVTSLK